MSSSSLYVIDHDYNGYESAEYKNSWLFTPIVWNVLLDKYMHDEIQTPYGYKRSMITDGEHLSPQLNEIVNNSSVLSDRICWEMSNQQIFFVKDRHIVADSIRKFLSENTRYDICKDEGVSYLKLEHIVKRFNQIADDIDNIDEDKYECFVFKNTSVDDGVERWFERYDEDSDGYVERSLRDCEDFVSEFVFVDGDSIKFLSNLEFFDKEATE